MKSAVENLITEWILTHPHQEVWSEELIADIADATGKTLEDAEALLLKQTEGDET